MTRLYAFMLAALACNLAAAGIMLADIAQIIAPSPAAFKALLTTGMLFLLSGMHFQNY